MPLIVFTLLGWCIEGSVRGWNADRLPAAYTCVRSLARSFLPSLGSVRARTSDLCVAAANLWVRDERSYEKGIAVCEEKSEGKSKPREVRPLIMRCHTHGISINSQTMGMYRGTRVKNKIVNAVRMLCLWSHCRVIVEASRSWASVISFSYPFFQTWKGHFRCLSCREVLTLAEWDERSERFWWKSRFFLVFSWVLS